MGKTRVLIADDSPTAVDIIASILESDPDIVIVGKAVNGREAVALADALRPDVITVDINMPVMNGLDAIKSIMAHQPTPILVITSSTDANIAFQSLSFGALEVVEKPQLESSYRSREYDDFIRKVKMIARVKVITHISGKTTTQPHAQKISPAQRVIGIVASTGGPRALAAILSGLPKELASPILIVQHIAEGFIGGLIEWLQDVTPLKVSLAVAGNTLEPGTVYVADHGRHMEMDSQFRIHLTDKEDLHGHRPSGTILFQSIARYAGRSSLGIVLTGMGRDGAEGISELKKAGGKTIAQDEATSLIFGMPKAAIDLGVIDQILPLPRIAEQIVRLTGIRYA